MAQDDCYNNGSTGSGRRTFILAAVVVLLAVSFAVSGWLVVSALNKIEGTDPFEANHTYEGDGYVIVDGVAHECVCSAESRSVSETSSYTVVSMNIRYECTAKTGTLLAEIMFDSNRVPVSGFTFVGKEGDLDEWQKYLDGTTISYYLDSQCLIKKLCVSSDSMELSLNMVV